MSSNFFHDNDDLRFQFSRVPWDELVPLVEASEPGDDGFQNATEARETYEEILEMLGAFSAEQIAPHWEEFDAQHPELADGEVKDAPRMATVMKGLAELGAMGLALPRNLGGMNAPLLVNSTLMELLARGEVSVMSHFGFHGGIAQSMLLYSVEEGSATIEDGKLVDTRWREQIESMASGESWGAMVLTEPGAGSDLAKVRSKAVQDDDGTWRVTGQKIYITSGHGEHHIVLARSEPEDTHPGLKGLSLFYVPQHLDDGSKNFEIGGIEHKMGQHSGAVCTINYDDSRAELIGTRGHGFRGMLLLMNNARIAVGFEALGLMEAAYRKAAAYAEERVSMGKPIAQHEMIADYLEEMDLNIRGLRAITFEAAIHEELASRTKSRLKIAPPDDEDELRASEKKVRRLKRRARHLTPLIKYFAGEEAVATARMSMQVFGGIGYINECGVEKLLRDALILPVYEGTSQIQALMALKDNIQAVLRNPGRFFSEMAQARVEAVRGKDDLDRGLARLRGLSQSGLQSVLTRIAADKIGDLRGTPMSSWRAAATDFDPKRDFGFGLLHAERLTKLLVWTAIGEVLVRQAHDVAGTEHEDERREIARRWLERYEPRARGVLGEIEADGGGLLSTIFRRKRRPSGRAGDPKRHPRVDEYADASGEPDETEPSKPAEKAA